MTWPTKTDFVDGDVLTAAQVNNIGTNLNLANPTGITDGYVLTADGAGSMGWEAIAGGSYTLITSGTITSTASTVISSITQDYTHLEIWLYNVNIASSNTIRIDMYDGTYPGSSGYTVSSESISAGVSVSANGTMGAYGFIRLFGNYNVGGSGYPQNFFRARFYDYASTTIANKFAEGFSSFRSTGGSNYVGTRCTANVLQNSAVGLNGMTIAGGTTITSASYRIWGIN